MATPTPNSYCLREGSWFYFPSITKVCRQGSLVSAQVVLIVHVLDASHQRRQFFRVHHSSKERKLGHEHDILENGLLCITNE